ncbi:hypothetical protein SALBM135S_03502 [Streptomyces alboniger]
MKRRAHSSSTGSALTSARWTTAPAITSKMRSAVRAAASPSGSAGSSPRSWARCRPARTSRFWRSTMDARMRSRSGASVVDSATTAMRAVFVSGRPSRCANCRTTPSMSAARLPLSGSSSSSKSSATASTTSSLLPAQRRYSVVLATPARVATAPSVSFDQPSSTRPCRVASRIAASAAALRGRPPVRVEGVVGRCMPATIPAGRDGAAACSEGDHRGCLPRPGGRQLRYDP